MLTIVPYSTGDVMNDPPGGGCLIVRSPDIAEEGLAAFGFLDGAFDLQGCLPRGGRHQKDLNPIHGPPGIALVAGQMVFESLGGGRGFPHEKRSRDGLWRIQTKCTGKNRGDWI
jgi:hypothetical protein